MPAYNNYESVILATGDGRCKLELVPEFGGLTNRLCLTSSEGKTLNILAGLATRDEMKNNESFKGALLFPFANRIDAGAYEYEGSNYHFPCNEYERNNALHGFLYLLQPELVALENKAHEASASLVYRYPGGITGYPFPTEIVMDYRLSHQEGLTIQFTVKNLHSAAIPVGLGWHPYFKLDQLVDSLRLQLPAVIHIDVDARMLPTGEHHEFTDFESPELIADREFDDCFQIKTTSKSKEIKTTLWSDEKNLGIEIVNQQSLPFLQLYIPPDRQTIAIEPMSMGINAFNTGEGLVHLAAGEQFSAQCAVRLIDKLSK